ncbi:hypothetical protein CCLMGIMDO_CCLMGIMDO_00751 [Companilactobacillus crustorum]|nr:hypothetical protein [Companilactobacillus crustorum]
MFFSLLLTFVFLLITGFNATNTYAATSERNISAMLNPLSTVIGVKTDLSQSDIPAPPETGPSIQDNFYVNGDVPTQNKEYANMQVVADGNKNKTQTLWYKNQIDITKPFATSFYVYMAGSYDSTTGKANDIADGITFTMQSAGTGAIGNGGGSLGVYGTMNTSWNNFGGISHALSMEFDPYYNDDPAQYHGTDHDAIPNNPHHQHITFVKNEDNVIISGASRKMIHNSVYDADANNDNFAYPYTNINDTAKWKKVIIQWTPDTSTGKGIISGNYYGHDIKPYTLDLSYLNANNNKVYWGFTGSTGEHSMLAAIAYTGIAQQPTIKKTVRNITNNETDFKQSTAAKKDDEIEYKISLNNSITNGLGDTWKGVTVKDTLPTGITPETSNLPSGISVNGNTVNVNVGDIPISNANKDITFKAKVSVNDNVNLDNIASAKGTNYPISSGSDVKSNEATVNISKIVVDSHPKLSIDNNVINKTYTDPSNTSTLVNNVLAGDNVVYNTSIKNSNPNAIFAGIFTYYFNIPNESNINSVKIDGKDVPATNTNQVQPYYYRITSLSNGDKQIALYQSDASIYNGDLTTHKIVVDTTISALMSKPVNTKHTIQYNDNNQVIQMYGSDTTVNPGPLGITLNPRDIKYVIRPSDKIDEIVDRSDEYNNAIPDLQVSDQRRDIASPAKITVSQKTPFTDSSNDQLPLVLRYYFDDGTYKVIDSNGIVIQTSAANNRLSSIYWSKDQGPKLLTNGTNFKVGNYKTTLTWTATDSL